MKSLKTKIFLITTIIVALGIIVIFRLKFYSESKNKPNIILITVDALRPDHLNCYGYRRNTSPNIDQLAKDGIIFTQSVSQASVTLVSVASFLTSVYPTRHGIITQHLDYSKDLSYPTIIDILNSANYQTAIFIPYGKFVTRWLEKTVNYSFKYKYTKENFLKFSRAAFLTKTAIEWLEGNDRFPFFVWIHYNDPHTPYVPPFPYNKLYVRDEFYNPDKKIPLVDNLEGWGGIPADANLDNIQELDYYIAQYDGEIRYTDYWIGKLMDNLKTRGLYDDSLIIISADHGEAFGEHNLYCEHANTLYDELIRVPLIIKFPEKMCKGKIIKRQVRLIDLMPTILDYLNFDIPQHIDGESVMPLLNGQGTYSARFSFSKTGIMNAMRTDKWKLIYYEGNHYELYNLEDDPYELNNVYNLEKEFADLLKSKMDNILNSKNYIEEKSGKKDKEIEELLRSLGYVQ